MNPVTLIANALNAIHNRDLEALDEILPVLGESLRRRNGWVEMVTHGSILLSTKRTGSPGALGDYLGKAVISFPEESTKIEVQAHGLTAKESMLKAARMVLEQHEEYRRAEHDR